MNRVDRIKELSSRRFLKNKDANIDNINNIVENTKKINVNIVYITILFIFFYMTNV